MKPILAIGADHRGFTYKTIIKERLDMFEWIDVGAYDAAPSDYPLFGHAVAQMVASGKVDGGILLCASGIGMSVVANRYPHVYAALVWSVEVARQSKEHDNANIVVLPSAYISVEDACLFIKHWQEASFLQGKYQRRIALIDQ